MQVELNELLLRYAGLRVRDASRQARMRASLAADGQQSAVTVIALASGTAHRFVLVDGYLRVAALRALGRDVVDAVCLELAESDALIMAHRLDEVGRRSALEEGWLLDELVSRHGLTQQELGTRLSRSRSWVSRRLSLVLVLPEVAQHAVRDGHLPAQAAMKYLVPLSRDKRASCERIVRNLGHEPVTVREVGRLYAGWRTSDAAQRERIEQHPRLFLRADETTRPDEKSDTELLIADLSAVSGPVLSRAATAGGRRRRPIATPPARRMARSQAGVRDARRAHVRRGVRCSTSIKEPRSWSSRSRVTEPARSRGR